MRLKFIFLDGAPRLGKQRICIVDAATDEPLVGFTDGKVTLSSDGMKAEIYLDDFAVEVKPDPPPEPEHL
jgi:hypothetical protein